MRQTSHGITIRTRGPGLYECTDEIQRWVAETEIDQGLLTLFVQHTSASLLIQENADPDVRSDLHDFFARLVPEDFPGFRHRSEGPDDMPAHIRSALTQTQISIPVARGAPVLGTWQGIFLFEHRRAEHERRIHMHIIGE